MVWCCHHDRIPCRHSQHVHLHVSQAAQCSTCAWPARHDIWTWQADEEDALESRRLREALAESQAKEAALEAQEVNLRQQLYSAQGQTRLLHELQQKLCEVPTPTPSSPPFPLEP